MVSPLKKIRSFTLTELLVVMAISVIVAGLAFSVMSLLKKNLFAIEKRLSSKTELRLFEEQFNLDLQKFPVLRYDDLNERLIFSSPIDSTIYKFNATQVLRDLDTIYLAPRSKEFYFAGRKKLKGTIDACKFVFVKDSVSQTIFSFKRNDAVTNIKYGN